MQYKDFFAIFISQSTDREAMRLINNVNVCGGGGDPHQFRTLRFIHEAQQIKSKSVGRSVKLLVNFENWVWVFKGGLAVHG